MEDRLLNQYLEAPLPQLTHWARHIDTEELQSHELRTKEALEILGRFCFPFAETYGELISVDCSLKPSCEISAQEQIAALVELSRHGCRLPDVYLHLAIFFSNTSEHAKEASAIEAAIHNCCDERVLWYAVNKLGWRYSINQIADRLSQETALPHRKNIFLRQRLFESVCSDLEYQLVTAEIGFKRFIESMGGPWDIASACLAAYLFGEGHEYEQSAQNNYCGLDTQTLETLSSLAQSYVTFKEGSVRSALCCLEDTFELLELDSDANCFKDNVFLTEIISTLSRLDLESTDFWKILWVKVVSKIPLEFALDGLRYLNDRYDTPLLLNAGLNSVEVVLNAEMFDISFLVYIDDLMRRLRKLVNSGIEFSEYLSDSGAEHAALCLLSHFQQFFEALEQWDQTPKITTLPYYLLSTNNRDNWDTWLPMVSIALYRLIQINKDFASYEKVLLQNYGVAETSLESSKTWINVSLLEELLNKGDAYAVIILCNFISSNALVGDYAGDVRSIKARADKLLTNSVSCNEHGIYLNALHYNR